MEKAGFKDARVTNARQHLLMFWACLAHHLGMPEDTI
jgi:hypothetical protein